MMLHSLPAPKYNCDNDTGNNGSLDITMIAVVDAQNTSTSTYGEATKRICEINNKNSAETIQAKFKEQSSCYDSYQDEYLYA